MLNINIDDIIKKLLNSSTKSTKTVSLQEQDIRALCL